MCCVCEAFVLSLRGFRTKKRQLYKCASSLFLSKQTLTFFLLALPIKESIVRGMFVVWCCFWVSPRSVVPIVWFILYKPTDIYSKTPIWTAGSLVIHQHLRLRSHGFIIWADCYQLFSRLKPFGFVCLFFFSLQYIFFTAFWPFFHTGFVFRNTFLLCRGWKTMQLESLTKSQVPLRLIPCSGKLYQGLFFSFHVGFLKRKQNKALLM